jgi:hypothetical protein
MTFTFDELKLARERGYSDDEIWNTLASEDKEIGLAKQRGYSLDEVASITSGQPIPEPEPSGTSFGEEVSQLGSAFVESIGRPLENMGESFESFGFSGVANALKGAITEPENYVSAGQRFMEPAQDEAQLMGFAWQYAPRAAVEQVGQVIGAIGTRAVGAAAGGAVAGPPGVIAGGFLGPAVFGAAQVIGPVAKERAMNNGREVPNNSDLVAATLTAIGSGSLDAIGAQFLPGGRKAAPKFFKKVASAFVGEGLLTEAPQSVIEQIGATAGTEKGLNINVKQAVGEGLIGGTSAAGLTAIVSPFSKPAENQVIRTPEEAEELDIDSKANQEAVLLMGDPADQTQNERVTKLKEIESVIANNETLMTGLEPNAPERSKLDLENRVAKKEAEKLKAEITQGAGLSETITEAERQQIELAKAITAPAAPTVKESLTVPPAPKENVVTPTKIAPLPQRTIEESIQNKDTFEFEGMRGAVSIEDGATVFRPFGTNDKYEVPINPNQFISEIEGIQWVRKGQTRQAPVEPTIPEVAAIVESQPQITEEEFNSTEDDFQLPQSLIEIEKSPTLNAIADIFNTGESKIVQEGKRKNKVSATPEFYRQITPEQIDVANRQIDNALRIIDNLPVSEDQKQTLAEPYLLIDQDISSYENNPEYKQYKASIRRQVRPTGKAVAFPETISEVAAGVKELEQRQGITKPAPAITPAPVAETPAVTEAPAAEVAPKTEPKITIVRDVTGEPMEAINRVPSVDIPFFESLRNVTLEFNKRPSKKRRNELISEAEEARKELARRGYSSDNIKAVEMGYAGVPLPEKPTPAVSETITPTAEPTEVTKFADEALRERDKEVGRYKKKADAERKAGREEMAQRYEGMIDDLMSVPANEFKQDVIENPEYYIESNVDPFLRFKNKEVNRAASTTKPAKGISVGNRIKLGKSPQTYIVEEVVPQSEVEKANGEQFYSVKNEKTGEVQVVEKADMKRVKKSADTRKTVVGDTQYQTEGVIPESERFTEDELRVIVNDIFGGKIPDKIEIITDATNPNKEFKAAYSIRRGTITYNLAYLAKGDNLRFVTNHELGHFILGDPKFQKEMARLFDTLPTDIQEKLKKAIDEAYAQEGLGVRAEETIVFAFGEILENAPDGRNILQRFLDAIRDAINRLFKTEGYIPRNPKKAAAAILLAARNKFERGEFIRRPNGSIVSITPDIRRMAVRRSKIMRVEAGEEVDSPEGIIAKTKALLRKQFDPTKVSKQNTTEAFRALGRLTGKDGTDFAKELNDVGRVVDESGAASEISMGAALFINDLFEYSIRLAAEGNKKLLGMMLTNINKLPTAAIGVSDAARDLRARLELAQRFLTMAQAEQDAYTNYVAEFIYGPNPTKDQIQSIKDAYTAVEKTPQVTEQELTDEIKAVGDRSGTDLVGKINEEFTKATEKGKEKRKTEIEELGSEYKKIQEQADKEIEKLAKIQSDTPSFDPTAARQTANDVRAIVANDLKQRPDMGRKAPWKSMLVAKLQEAGVEVAAAETLADIVWRQHEINNLSRELSSINKAIEKGPISEIVKAIKETPLEDQQKTNWRYEVMRDYLRKAGLPTAQAERIAKLMDISLQKRFTMAQEQAFTDAISKTAPWKSGDTRSRRAFQKVLQALRAGALDPARNVLSDMAALNGWTGFSPEQYKALLKYDAILADPESADATKAEAHKAIQDIISKAKLPIRARDVIGQYYDAQALSGIPTVTVNIFSPAGLAVKNALTQSLNGVLTARPEQITASLTTFIDSIKSWANTVAFSFKNNVTVYSNVEYLVNDEGLLKLYKKGVDQFNNGKTPRDRADGVKNMMIGMMDYVRRVLNALDYGAIASLQNQAVSKYALAAMQAKGMSSKDGAKMLNAMMEAKRDFYNKQIAIGTDKNKAAVLADEFFISSWRQALTDAKLPAQEVMDAALNDAMSAVGRNRQSLDAFREEETNIRDNGVTSFPAIWLLETMANAANKQESQFIKIFSRVIYGFAVVPARVLRETAWFSPYGAVRFAYYHIAKNMGLKNPYAQGLGNDLQYRQRLTETIAGSLVMLAFAAAMSASTEDEEDEKPFKIVVTGNGPLRNEDPQYHDSWMKKNKPNTASVYFGKTKFTINTMRGFEAFAWPAMMLGAVDDWNIRRKQKRETNTPKQMGDAAIVAGFVLSASLRRGPYAFAAKPLFEAYGDRGVESLAKSLAFPVKTIIPVLGSSLAGNISNFLNEPVDRRTLDGAVWSNIPFIGPAVAPKSLNAFGEPALSTDLASKMFKLGVPIVYDIPTDRESIKLHELVLKQGGGPSIPTRNQLAQRLDREPTNKEYEMFVREYGTILTTSMKKNYDKLFNAKPEFYSKAVERIGNRARDIAENKVRQAAKKP